MKFEAANWRGIPASLIETGNEDKQRQVMTNPTFRTVKLRILFHRLDSTSRLGAVVV
jgi:hypothetical protein